MRWHLQVLAGHGINQNRSAQIITKSEFSGQTNRQGVTKREKATSDGAREIALDSGCFWWMKNQSISIRDLIERPPLPHARQMQQARQLQQDQAAAQRHHCQPGYVGAVIIHADGTRSLICEQR